MISKVINRRIFLIGILGVSVALVISITSFLKINRKKKNAALVEFEGWIVTISDKEKLIKG